MSEESGSKKEGGIFNIKLTRRQLLTAAGGAVLALIVPEGPLAEFGKPNPFIQKAMDLWDEYQSNPEKFKRESPDNIEENLIAGADGVHLRDVPSARAGKEGIIDYLNPGEPVGVALVHREIKLDPVDGTFVIIKRGGQIYFVARRKLLNPQTDTLVQVTNKP